MLQSAHGGDRRGSEGERAGRPRDVPSIAPSSWERLSSRYDRQLWLERASIRRLLELAAPAETDRVVDVATGTGAVLRELAVSPRRPRQVTGIDLAAGMLAQIPPLPTGWAVRRADARSIPAEDGAFDLVTAAYLLHVLGEEDRAGVLAEVRRVLPPGGRFAVVTTALPPRWPLRGVAAGLDRLARAAPEQFGGLRALDPRAALVSAGFEVQAVRFSTRGYLALCALAVRR